MATNYVKFRRGTPAAFKAILDEHKAEKDTLYFIYEEDENSGELYLGSKLIASGDDIVGATTLQGLTDVLLSEQLSDQDCLIYDINQNQGQGGWVNKPIKDILPIFVGTIGETSGVAGLVPAPTKEQTNMFLRSDGVWTEIVVASDSLVLQTIVADGENHEAARNRIIADNTINKGDVIVLKDLIADGLYEHTSYVYNGNEWVAMDGNYDATNIILASDLTITADIGVQKLNGAGSKVLETAGKNLKQVLDMLLASRVIPTSSTNTAPSVSVSPSKAQEYEVGTEVEVSYSATFNDGKYAYEPGEDTGVTVNTWTATFNGETLNDKSGTFTVTLGDDFSDRVKVVAAYGAGAIPKDNLGNEITDTEELKTAQIQAGSKTNYSGYVKSYRNMYYGSFVLPIETTGANVRDLSAKKAEITSFDMEVVEGANQVVIAVPSKYSIPTVADNNAFGTNIAEKFIGSTVTVAGASEGYDTNYTVYVYSPSAALSANTYTVYVV